MGTKAKVEGLAACRMIFLLLITSLAAASDDLTLLDAVKSGNIEVVQSLLKRNADVNVPQPDGATTLHWAVHRDDLDTVDLLIRAGADVTVENDYGVTPLWLACTNRNTAMVEKLLKSGADPNVALWTGETVLMTCVGTGNLEAVNLLLAHGVNVNAKESRRGQTALIWAIYERHPEVARVLIEHGADIHARSHMLKAEGFTPMIFDTYGGDVQASSRGGFTPLLFAAQEGNLETAQLLVARGADVNEASLDDGPPLVVATANGYEELALFLLEKGADPDATDSSGVTALHYALREGMKGFYQIKEESGDSERSRKNPQKQPNAATGLAAGGVAIDQSTDVQATADVNQLLLKSSTKHVQSPFLPGPNMSELVKALLANGADPNARIAQVPYRLRRRGRPQVSVPGATPLLLAAVSGDVATMRILVERRAKPLVGTEIDKEEMARTGYSDSSQFQGTATPLLVAAGLGRSGPRSKAEEKMALEAAQMLVALGADVNEANEVGWTPLQAAAWTGADTIVQFLLEKGAKIDVQNGCGQTPLSLAAGTSSAGLRVKLRPRKSTVELLRKWGAGNTPLTDPVGHCIPGRVPALADVFGI